VEIRQPFDRAAALATVRLRNLALSTSGLGEQRFMHEGRQLGHVLDPRTGAPAWGVLQATAFAATATEAEVWSTAFAVNGLAWAETFCRRHPEVGALIVPEPGNGPLQVVALGRAHDVLAERQGG
jgi:thiamine biosynthesis lipoprotein